MKSLRILATIAICVLGSSAHAALTQLSFQPNPVDLNDLDHHDVTTWRIDNIDLNNAIITSATLTFKNIANWDNNPNMLFVWLLDTSLHSGVTITQDVDLNQVPVTDISDAFLGSLPTLISSSTAKTKLFQHSFTTSATDFVYTLSAAEISALTTYINNGHDLAFGFDPDCHYFNDGVTFTMNLATPIPEAGTVVPVGILLFAAISFEIRRRRQLATKCLVTE
jgi:hypothetical protein